MLAKWTRASLVVAWTLLTVPTLFAQVSVPSAALLPATTKGLVSTPDVNYLYAQWEKTQLGQLMKDPLMKPFADDIRGQLKERFADANVKLGLTWDDMKDVPSGEVAIARIQPGPGKAALVMLGQVKGRDQKVAALIAKITANLTKQGATQGDPKDAKRIGGVPIIGFVLPKQPGDDEAKQVFYFHTPEWLVAADDGGVIEGILARVTGGGDPATLDKLPAFRAVMERCQKELGQRAPQLRWFAEPFGYYEVLQAVNPDRFQQRRRGRSIFDVLKEQGFTAIQGAGGVVDFSADGFEVLHRTSIFAPPPFEKSAKMLVLPNYENFQPQPWVPRDVATYATGYAGVLNAFDNFGPLFDELFGEGEKGVWEEVLDGLKRDPNGPQIDLRNELVAQLGQRVTMISDYETPITPNCERLLYAIDTRDEKAVAAAIAKMMKTDPNVKQREFEGHVIWETVQEAGGQSRRPDVVVHNIPSLGPKPRRPQQQAAVLPNKAITVAYGHLFVASHIDFLKKVLKQPAEGDPLGGRLDFKLVDDTLNRFGVPANCMRSFSRTDEEYRPTYELIQQGKMPESKTMLGRALNQLLGSSKKGVIRKQEIDGRNMPNYQVVRRHLGPAGMLAYTEATGWYIVGFTLKK